MKIKFYLLPLILFLFLGASGQVCNTLTATYVTAESRCVATGSITITASGGSGSYNYKAVGPITTPVTSSNIITGLPPGYYSIIVKDLASGCSLQLDSIHVTGNYDDPRFQLVKTDATCRGNDGTISAANVQFGRSPFTYAIIAPSPSNIGATSASGSFSGLTPGEYSIQLRDSCGGIQVRRITIENYSWWFDTVAVDRVGCDSADVLIKLKDNKGNVNTSGAAFNGFSYGYAIGTDTTWSPIYNFRIFIGTRRSLNIVVKDNCGNVHSTVWFLPEVSKPSLSAVAFSNLTCTNFAATVTGQHLTNPNFCLYDDNGNTFACNTTGVFNNVPYGSYCIEAVDACYDTTIVRCFVKTHAVPAVAPSIQVSNQSCSTFTAAITGQQNLTNPNYCLYNASNVQLSCNSTGVFNNLPYGSYCIKVNNGCGDTVINRCVTAVKPPPALTGYNITGSTCTGFNVSATGSNLISTLYCLYDSAGNVVACDSSGSFSGIAHGSYCIRAISCGDTTNSVCFSTSRPRPTIGSGITITNRKCATFGAAIWGQANLTNPQYCLYNSADSLLQCNSTGSFDSLAYGSYCIKVVNTCYDTTIIRCFSELPIPPSLNSTMQILSSNCTTVSFQVNGSHLTNPQYCLYDATDMQLACNTTGTFSNYAYGTYCVRVMDGCMDTTMRICQTFAPVHGISLTTSKSCTIGNAYIDVLFANGNAPYTVKVYHPNGAEVYANTTSSNPLRIQLPALPAGRPYKVVGIDNCGNRDTASIIPDANLVTKSTTVRAKCPSALWLNGAGDLLATCTTNQYTVAPQIIKKNGLAFVQSFSSVSGSTYTFADLEPAQYIVAYTQSSCNSKIYDTVTVPPYAYPSQGQSAIYQCDNNGFSLGADVQGGVSPYTFQIIGSLPATPAITTAPQSSPVFNINTGTTYSLVRLRTVDACGNATLSDVSVLPLQNISIKTNDSCFFRNITLTVDILPNATYLWYRKTSPTDSTLLGSGLTYNLPFFQPEETGEYVCKVIINGGCLTRLTRFTLDGNCNSAVLPVSVRLQARKTASGNQLYWSNDQEAGVQQYVVERKRPYDRSYVSIGTVSTRGNRHPYTFDDAGGNGTTLYRLQLKLGNRSEYTNIVSLGADGNGLNVYPNPVNGLLNIAISSPHPANYRIELVSVSGQTVYSTELRKVQSIVIPYKREKNIQPGIYLLKVTDTDARTTEVRKLLFE